MAKKIHLTGGVGDQITIDKVKAELPTDGSDVDFELSSLGGYVSDGIVVHNAIRDYPGKKTLTINGIVASIAAYISTAFDVKDISVYDNSIFMIHNAMGFAVGDHNSMRQEADMLQKMDGVLAAAYAKQTGKTKQEMLDLMGVGVDNKGSWFFGKDIIDAGFASTLIDSGQNIDKDGAVAMAFNSFRDFSFDTKRKLQDSKAVASLIGTEPPAPAPVQNKPKEKKPVEKAELLAELKKQGLTLDEMANAVGAKDLEILASIKKEAGDDPIKTIKDLKTRERNVILSENFGPVEYENKEVNALRAYADKVLNDLSKEGIEAFKKDPVALQLAGQRQDADNPVNQVGKTEGANTTAGGTVAVNY